MTPEFALEIAISDKYGVEDRPAYWDALSNAQMALSLLRQVLADPNTKIMTAYRLRLEGLLK